MRDYTRDDVVKMLESKQGALEQKSSRKRSEYPRLFWRTWWRKLGCRRQSEVPRS